MRTSKWLIHTHTDTRTDRHTDAGDDNTRRPKLASGNKWHTFWSWLIRCLNMKWIRMVLWKIQSGQHSVHRRMNRQTDGKTDKVKPVYPPSTSLSGGIISSLSFTMVNFRQNTMLDRTPPPPPHHLKPCLQGESWVVFCEIKPVTGEFPAQRPVRRSFDVFFDLRLNKRLSKQSWGWRFETLSGPLWRHCNVRICHHH